MANATKRVENPEEHIFNILRRVEFTEKDWQAILKDREER